MESALNKYGDKSVRWSSQGMLRLTLDAMKRLFSPTLEQIKKSIADILDSVQGKNSSVLCMDATMTFCNEIVSLSVASNSQTDVMKVQS